MLDQALLSDALGYLSILCWLGAQLPQVIVNIRTKSVEGLALPFLANWLFGDITNLVGCILTHQLPFQTYLASYFVFVDMSLVAQYIYYYKPPLPPSPDYSPTSSRTASLAMTLTPTAAAYSPRNLTRPSSRTPLLVGEVEAGYRTYSERARSQTGSSRFSGVMSSYPPAGLLPSADEVDGKGKARRQSSKPSVSSLRRHAEKSTHEDKAHHYEDEGDDELSAMTESFHSDISASAAGDPRGIKRHVSWSKAVAEATGEDTTGDNTPRQGIIAHPALTRNQDSIASTSTNPPTHEQEEEEIRRRSRSRGRASRRHRPSPLLVYELASPTTLLPIAGTSSGMDSDGNQLSARDLLHMDVAAQRERDSKSGSRRRRSASIVFLSVGFGALLAFGGAAGEGTVASNEAGFHGRVLGMDVPSSPWDLAPAVSSLALGMDDFVPLYSADDSQDSDAWTQRRRRRRPHDSPPLTREQKRRLVGRISAWACTTLYLTSRLPQIWKNYTRKSVQGLSLALFVFAFLGNTFYVASILSNPKLWEYPPEEGEPSSTLMQSALGPLISATASKEPPYNSPRARAFLRESLPYLLGSGGTLCFDVIIVSQGVIYGRREKQRLEEEDESDDDEGADTSEADGESSAVEAEIVKSDRTPVVEGSKAPGTT